MNGRQLAWVATGVILLSGLPVSQAQAGRVMFGTDESIHLIQPTKNWKYSLCYKTSTFFFLAGCYVTDDGYVLQKAGELDGYAPLTSEMIQQLQQVGELPTPLPQYSLSFFDYLIGYSNWIILAFFLGIPAGKWAWGKLHTKPTEQGPPSPPTAEKDVAADGGV